MFYNYSHNYVVNHLIINSKKKNLKFELLYTKKTFRLISFFKKIGLLTSYFCFNSKNFNKIKITLSFYKHLPICKNLKLFSTPSRSFYMSHKAIVLLHNRTIDSIYLLSTIKGLMTHLEAMRLNLGGKVLLLITL